MKTIFQRCSQHVSSAISKATQRVGVFCRGFTSRNLALICKTSNTYFDPEVANNSTVWNPTRKYHQTRKKTSSAAILKMFLQ